MIEASDVSLKSTIICVHQRRHHVLERLGQHHVRHGLGARHAERGGRLHLARAHRLHAGAHDLAEVRGLEDDEGGQRHAVLRDGRRSSCGTMNQIQKITMTSGTPRKNSTYMVAGTRIHARLGAAGPAHERCPSRKPEDDRPGWPAAACRR
jgi:hypothetical protein